MMPYKPNLRQPYPNELYHHGIKGQKWGVRRFQNADGSYTAAGKKRYSGETGIKGLFSKKKKNLDVRSENEKEFTRVVEDAGFKKWSESGVKGSHEADFFKDGFNKKYPDLRITVSYLDSKDSNAKKAIDKANRFMNNSNKIVSNSIDKVIDKYYPYLVEHYNILSEINGAIRKPPTKSEMRNFIKPTDIDVFDDRIFLQDSIGDGLYELKINKDTYEPTDEMWFNY